MPLDERDCGALWDNNYDDVDLKRVWAVANTFVPDLIAYIEPLLPPEE